MLDLLLQDLRGQHVYWLTDDAADFHLKLGFMERPVGMEKGCRNLARKPMTVVIYS